MSMTKIRRWWSRVDSFVVLVIATARCALVVFVLLWSQPLIEQVAHGRDGNMARMIRAASVLGNNPGPRLRTQIAATTLAPASPSRSPGLPPTT
jgi:hypothetical protein